MLPTKKQKTKVPQLQGRLPDGAEFRVKYDATTESWSGTLTVEGTIFTHTYSGVFHLLRGLDFKYRQAKQLVEGS